MTMTVQHPKRVIVGAFKTHERKECLPRQDADELFAWRT